MENSDYEEGLVTGVLGFVLRATRICGLAPLKFKREGDSWRIHVSKKINYFGVCVLWILCITAWIFFALHLCLYFEMTLSTRLSSETVTKFVSGLSITMVIVIQTTYGRDRIESAIICLAQLQKINGQLNKFATPKSFDLIRRTMTAFSFITVFLIFGVHYVTYFYRTASKEIVLSIEFIAVTYFLQVGIVNLLFLQVSLIILELISSFNHLNVCLKKLLKQIHNDQLNVKTVEISQFHHPAEFYSRTSYSTINNAIDSLGVFESRSNPILETIDHLGCLYSSLCEVAQEMHNSHDSIQASLMIYSIVNFLLMSYSLIAWRTTLLAIGAGFWKFVIPLYWCVWICANAIMIIESHHRAHSEMNHTKVLISQLLRFSPPDHHALILELEEFYMLLMATPVSIFRLKRADIITIISITTTYLFVLV